MAKSEYEAEALYDVQLARPIKVGRTTLLPNQSVKLKGKVVEENKADILGATKVAE